jgi:hypothetical protein
VRIRAAGSSARRASATTAPRRPATTAGSTGWPRPGTPDERTAATELYDDHLPLRDPATRKASESTSISRVQRESATLERRDGFVLSGRERQTSLVPVDRVRELGEREPVSRRESHAESLDRARAELVSAGDDDGRDA